MKRTRAANGHASRLGAALRALLAASFAVVPLACDSSSDAPVDAGTIDARCEPVPLGERMVTPDCGVYEYVLPCGAFVEPARDDCLPSVDLCSTVCPLAAQLAPCDYEPDACAPDGAIAPGATVVLGCPTCLGNLGRRPRGLTEPPRTTKVTAIEAWAADAFHLEAASVHAFRDLAHRLDALGAPARLVRGCARAARDEARHARAAARVARRLGGRVTAPRVNAKGATSLEALVRENAVEGCVRETFAVLVAMHQAARATDGALARHARSLVADEARHAALAWRIDAWGMARLDARARRRVERARARALDELAREAEATRPSVLVSRAGLPSTVAARDLVERFARAVLASQTHCSR